MMLKLSALGEHVDILSGFAFESKFFNEEGRGLPVIRIRNISDGESNTFYEGHFDSRFLIKPGEIVIGMDGGFNRARWSGTPSLLNQRVCRIRSISPKLDEQYLFHFLPSALKSIEDRTPFVTVKHLSSKDIASISIPLPPLDEQRRIAAILDQADDLRLKRRLALVALSTLAHSLFGEMFGRDMALGSSELKDFVPLGDIAEVVSGVTMGRKISSQYTRSVPYVTVVNVQDRSLNLSLVKTIEATESEINRYRLQRNDLLLTEGGDPDKLGRGTLWRDELPECIHQNHIFRVRLVSENFNPVFLNWLVGSEYGKNYFLRSAKQTTGIASINMTQLRAFPIMAPPRRLQDDFASRLSSIESLREVAIASQHKLDALFASIQHSAFSGRLVHSEYDNALTV